MKKKKSNLQHNVYDNIRMNMNVWQSFIYWALSIFYAERAPVFCKSIGLTQIIKELEVIGPNWFIDSVNILGPGFANNLFQLLASCHKLSPLFAATILNPDVRTSKVQKEPLLIEVIFHALYMHQPISSYPLDLNILSQNIDVSNVELFQSEIAKQYDEYVSVITDKNFESIDQQYTDWFYIATLLDKGHMDFLRRFDTYISFSDLDDDSPRSWSQVTTNSVIHYLESLFDDISKINIQNLNVDFLIALNESDIEDNYDYFIPEDILMDAFRTMVKAIQLFQQKNMLLKILCVAYADPALQIKITRDCLLIQNQFQSLVKNRIQGMSYLLTQNILSKEMEQTIADLGVTQIGVYTKEISDYCVKNNVDSFQYVYLVPLIKLFVTNHLNLWFKNFFSTLIVNVKFSKDQDLKDLELVYRKFNKFSIKCNKFIQNIGLQSTLSVRIQNFLHQDSLNDNDCRMLSVFVDSINSQANEVVLEFLEIHKVLYYAINSLVDDLSNNTNHYVLNIGSVKNILGESESKLYKLKNLLGHINEIAEVIVKHRAIIASQENDSDE